MNKIIVLLIVTGFFSTALAEENKEVPLFNDTIPAKTIPAIKKRVDKSNKNFEKVRQALGPKLNLDLNEYAVFTQTALNASFIIPDKGFLGECLPKESEHKIICYLFWPQKFTKNNISAHYTNYVEMVSGNVAESMSKRGAQYSFVYRSYLHINNDFVPYYVIEHNKDTVETVNSTNNNISVK